MAEKLFLLAICYLLFNIVFIFHKLFLLPFHIFSPHIIKYVYIFRNCSPKNMSMIFLDVFSVFHLSLCILLTSDVALYIFVIFNNSYFHLLVTPLFLK